MCLPKQTRHQRLQGSRFDRKRRKKGRDLHFHSDGPVDRVIKITHNVIRMGKLYNHGSAAGCDHEHGVSLSDGLVVEVDAYDGVSSHLRCSLLHLSQSCVLGLA